MLKLTNHKTIASLPALLQPGQRAIVLKFTAAWCAPCRTMAPIVAAAEARHPEAAFAEVDIDANPELATALHVTYIPQVIVVDRAGKVAGPEIGVKTAAMFEALLSERLARCA